MTAGDVKGYYDDFSGWYERERHRGYHALVDDIQTEIVRPLSEGREVLEVGCGTGLIMQRLTEGAGRVVGVDLSLGMLSRSVARGLEAVVGSAEALPFARESFDLVYSFKVLAHVPDVRRALAEMLRVLRPGGHLVAEFYNALSLRRLAKLAGGPGRVSASRTEAEVFTRWDTPRQAAAHLPHGLVVERWRGVRAITPGAAAFRVPGLGTALGWAERRLSSSPLARFAGFLVAVCRKS